MPTGLYANRRCASLPSVGHLDLSSLQHIEVGVLDGSMLCVEFDALLPAW
jgi:hypothetical protein